MLQNCSNMNNTMSFESHMIAFEKVPLTALSKKTLQKLSQLLNSKKIMRSEEGYERDWRGVACLAKQKFLYDENTIHWEDPIAKVIQLWCKNNPKTATFAYLEKFLEMIDRWDAADDIYENLVEDTKIYQTQQQQSIVLKQEENVVEMPSFNSDYGNDSNHDMLTMADIIRAQKGLPPQMYDAFVLYADADINYACELLTRLEDNRDYGFRFCMKNRDLLAGVQFEHLALTQLIEERCRHLIIILTEEFLKSPENNFLVNYVQALQIQHRTRKIIPLLYESNLNIPRTLKMYSLLHYKSSNASVFSFWSKLANSIRNVNATVEKSRPKQSKINENAIKEETEQDLLNYDMNVHNAPSTGQLQISCRANNANSMSDLSPTLACSDMKKKKNWSTKVFKKVICVCKLQKS